MLSKCCALQCSFFSRQAHRYPSSSCCMSLSFIRIVMLLPRMDIAQVMLSHRPGDDLTLLVPLACCRTISHCSSAITLSLSARFSSRLILSACPFTESYVMSRPRHQFSCRSLIVLTKSWSPSMWWKILSVSGLLVDRTSESL
jgi:hypothetical protein